MMLQNRRRLGAIGQRGRPSLVPRPLLPTRTVRLAAVSVRAFQEEEKTKRAPALDPELTKLKICVRPVKDLRHYATTKYIPVLALDGGGIRGILAARVAEEVENVIREEVCHRLVKDNIQLDRFEWKWEHEPGHIPSWLNPEGAPTSEQPVTDPEKSQWRKFAPGSTVNALAALQDDARVIVHLADYFGVLCGTSTGSILATYFATKGGLSDGPLERKFKQYDDPSTAPEGNVFKTIRERKDAVWDLAEAVKPAEAQYEDVLVTAAKTQEASVGSDGKPKPNSKSEPEPAEKPKDMNALRNDILNTIMGKEAPRLAKAKKDQDKATLKALEKYEENAWSVWMARQFLEFIRAGTKGLPEIKKGDDKAYEKLVDEAIKHAPPKGSARYAQATFVTYGKRIFQARDVDPMAFTPSNPFSSVEPKWWFVVKGILSTLRSAFGLFMDTSIVNAYSDAGITKTLQDVFGGDTMLSATADKGGVQAGLVIPALHVVQSRPVMFWALPQPPAFLGALFQAKVLEAEASSPIGQEIRQIMQEKKWPKRFEAGVPLVARNYYGYATVNRESPDIVKKKAGLVINKPYLTPSPGQPAPAKTSQMNLENTSAYFPVDFPLWQVVRSSTAAPTFFPSQRVTGVKVSDEPIPANDNKVLDDYFVDGGMIANEPIMQAVNCALLFRSNAKARPAVLSIGCANTVAPMMPLFSNGFPVKKELMGWVPIRNIIAIHMGAMPDTNLSCFLNVMNMSHYENDNIALRVQAVVVTDVPNALNEAEAVLPALSVIQESDSPDYREVKPRRPSVYKDDVVTGDQTKLAYWAQVVAAMDVPENWRTLLEIGAYTAEQYKPDIKKWVIDYLLPPKPSAGSKQPSMEASSDGVV